MQCFHLSLVIFFFCKREVQGTGPELTLCPEPLLENVCCTVYCNVTGSRPEVGITWDIDGLELLPAIETNPSNSDPDLHNTQSVVSFTPTKENSGSLLRCSVTGHEVTRLNGNAQAVLNVHCKLVTMNATVSNILISFDKIAYCLELAVLPYKRRNQSHLISATKVK